MPLLLGIMGLGGRLTSSGVYNNVKQLSDKHGWNGATFTHRAGVAPTDLLRKHQDEKIIVVANSMGVNTIDDILEDNPDLKVGRIFAVVSAFPENFPDNAEWITRVTASRDVLRNFEIKGRSVVTHELKAGHVDADDDPELWEMVEREMVAESDYKITPRIALEVAAHEGLVQEAYKDSVGIWTWSIGVTDFSGHKVRRYIDNPVDIDRCIEVYIWLLDTKYMPAVERAFKGRQLTESQIAAALSFHWNTGSIEKASWVKSWLAGDVSEAKRRFMLWNKPSEIIKRRGRERNLFFEGVWHGDGTVTHYPLVHAGGRLNFTQTKRLDISRQVTEAIEQHYSPALPVPADPPASSDPVPASDFSQLETAELIEALHQVADVVKGLATEIQRRGSPQITNSPAIEQGHSIEGNIEMTKSIFKSKTFWGIAGTLATVFFPPAGPIIDVLGGSAAAIDLAAGEQAAEAITGVVDALNKLIASATALFAIYGRTVAQGPASVSLK